MLVIGMSSKYFRLKFLLNCFLEKALLLCHGRTYSFEFPAKGLLRTQGSKHITGSQRNQESAMVKIRVIFYYWHIKVKMVPNLN